MKLGQVSIANFSNVAANNRRITTKGPAGNETIVRGKRPFLDRPIQWLRKKIQPNKVANENRNAMDSLVQSVHQQYGTKIASGVFGELEGDYRAGKVLTGAKISRVLRNVHQTCSPSFTAEVERKIDPAVDASLNYDDAGICESHKADIGRSVFQFNGVTIDAKFDEEKRKIDPAPVIDKLVETFKGNAAELRAVTGMAHQGTFGIILTECANREDGPVHGLMSARHNHPKFNIRNDDPNGDIRVECECRSDLQRLLSPRGEEWLDTTRSEFIIKFDVVIDADSISAGMPTYSVENMKSTTRLVQGVKPD